MAAGKGPDGRVHILADRSARFASPTRTIPSGCSSRRKYDADAIVYETNQGAEFIRSALVNAGAGRRKLVPITR